MSATIPPTSIHTCQQSTHVIFTYLLSNTKKSLPAERTFIFFPFYTSTVLFYHFLPMDTDVVSRSIRSGSRFPPMCGVPGIVEAAPAILDAAEKLGVEGMAHKVVKHTFFKHFCGGENLSEVLPTMEQFRSMNVGSILDLAIEADVDDEVEGHGAPTPQQTAEKVTTMVIDGIDTASQQSGSMFAVKITSLFSPTILQHWSTTLRLLQTAFEALDKDSDGNIGREEFGKLGEKFPGLAGPAGAKLFGEADHDKDGCVDWINMTDVFTLRNPEAVRTLVTEPPPTTGNEDKDFALEPITSEDIETATSLFSYVDSIIAHARDRRVRIMVDAEQYYFQPAIDDIAISLCRLYNPPLPGRGINHSNRKGPVVYNTYQMYLKDTFKRLTTDLERAERNGYAFGVKLVRGAYLQSERERAEELGYADPVNSSLEDTHNAYNRAIDYLAEKLFAQKAAEMDGSGDIRPLSFVVASHNKESVNRAMAAMEKYGVARGEGTVAFAQLMGMKDKTTFGLAANGYKAYKYIPYGPIEVTIPYLQRRAQENSAILGGGATAEDKSGLIEELKKRLKIAF
ncbi:hypothetical protein HDV00_003905 [Rhizophlyctis rosea]|nr:hypothetical protein HDV00_003905 [Rhizophlyctis rosea]